MKRQKHYAGDAIDTIQLPTGCRWIRVLDFDPLGFISQASNQSFSNNTPAQALLQGASTLPQEPPQILLDEQGSFRPVYSFMQWLAAPGKAFGSLQLQGNIEVEFGENDEPSPGPIRFGQQSTPFEFCLTPTFYESGTYYVMALPKSIKSMMLNFYTQDSATHPLTRVAIFAAFNQTQPFPSVPAQPSGSGGFSAWESGPDNRPYYAQAPIVVASLGGIKPIRPTIGVFGAGHAGLFQFTAAPTDLVDAVSVLFTDGGLPNDDTATRTFIRPWTPPTALILAPETVDGTSVHGIVVRGQITCAF